MGLKNNTQTIKYLRIKEGKFYLGKDTESPFGELEGTITGLRYKNEEFDGAPLRKLIITVNDGTDTYQVGLNVESQNYNTFVSFLRNADLTKPVTLHPKLEAGNKDGKDFKKHSILVSQDGTYLKGYFTKATPNGLPEWKSVKVGNKKVTDKSEFLEFLEQFVTRNYIPVVTKGAVYNSVVEKTGTLVEAETETTDDLLPWDN